MKVYKEMSLDRPVANVVATIGNFDGVHLGHQQLIKQVLAKAKAISGTSMVITFNPHPSFVLRPSEAPPLLNTYEEKLELLEKYGVDSVFEIPFSREFSNLTAAEFIHDFLLRRLDVRTLYLGHDFGFGRGRTGSVEILQTFQDKLEIFEVPAFKQNNILVSSSFIREALKKGDIKIVNECLGRPFFLKGLVWRGEGRGRTIGIPTANLQTVPRKYPMVGVYATKTFWRNSWYKSISNVGYNPTFKGDGTDLPLKIETHLFDFDEDMYGDEIKVEFYAFLRPEKKFSSVNDLLGQIKNDFTVAQKILETV